MATQSAFWNIPDVDANSKRKAVLACSSGARYLGDIPSLLRMFAYLYTLDLKYHVLFSFPSRR